VKAGEQEPVGRGQGWIKEKGEEGSQQGREGSKQEGETRGEGEVTEGTDSGMLLCMDENWFAYTEYSGVVVWCGVSSLDTTWIRF